MLCIVDNVGATIKHSKTNLYHLYSRLTTDLFLIFGNESSLRDTDSAALDY